MTEVQMSKVQMLRALVVSNTVINDVSGFNFRSVMKCAGGEIFTFHSLKGDGICFVKDGDRFKWSKAVILKRTNSMERKKRLQGM